MHEQIPAELNTALSRLPLSAVHYCTSTGSTNALAIEAAENGAADLSLFTADEQTEGRGRLGRRWETRPGSALAFSLLLRPTSAEAASAGLFSPWGAVALGEALELLGLRPQVKWPNDVLLNRCKVCGILPESTYQDGRLQYVVIGMGVNVTPAAVPPQEELKFPATSVEEVLGRPVDRWVLLGNTLRAMLAWRGRLGTAEFRQAWDRRLAFRGEWVIIGDGLNPERRALINGLATDGSLLLKDVHGEEFSVQAGEVSLRPEGSAER